MRPQSAASLILILGNQPKQAVAFVRYPGGEINAATERKKIPQPVKLKRGAIGAHKRLDEIAGDRIVIVNQAVTEIADPKLAVHESESPRRVEIAI